MNDETIKLDDTCQYIDKFVLNLQHEVLCNDKVYFKQHF